MISRHKVWLNYLLSWCQLAQRPENLQTPLLPSELYWPHTTLPSRFPFALEGSVRRQGPQSVRSGFYIFWRHRRRSPCQTCLNAFQPLVIAEHLFLRDELDFPSPHSYYGVPSLVSAFANRNAVCVSKMLRLRRRRSSLTTHPIVVKFRHFH